MKTKIFKKLFISLVLVIVILFIAAAGAIGFFGDRALKTGIEVAATSALNVDVTVDETSLSLLQGSLELEDLVVSNPKGYQHPNLLQLGQAYVDVEIKSLLSDTVNIEKMKFDNITLVVEQKGLTNNLKEVLDSIPSAGPAEPAEADRPAGKKLYIADLEITNITVKAKLLPIPGRLDTVTIKLDPIRMKDLGGDNKLDTAALTSKILVALATGMAKQGKDLLPTELVGPITSTLKEQGQVFVETGKKVLEKSTDVGKEVIEGGKDIGKEATDIFKGLFKSKDK